MDEDAKGPEDQAADKQPEPIEARQGPAADKQPESIEAQQDQAADKKPETIEAQQADKQPESIEAQQDQAADKQPESIEAQQGPAADKQPEPIELQGSNAHLQKQQQQQQQPPQEPQQPQPEPATSSSAPKNEYLAFREMLKHESALPLLSRLQDFVRQFPEGSLSRDQAADRIHKFLSATQEWMLSKVVVFAAEADEAEQVSASEGLEKFLMMRLHGKIFGLEKTDPEEDELLKRRIDSLSWVGFHNLGVPSVDVSLLDLAVSQLQSMDKFKAPRDKMICILNACRVINDVLKRAIVESGGGRPLAADDFLPLLIYCVILANPPRLHSNIEFVAAFRHKTQPERTLTF
ncbi:Vacuolar protein sorting-associated protein 9A (OsVPS9A) (Protein GLUTELIN PRECURSOR ACCUMULATION 2) [Durusdinium trenchii]|uniref:Vacuolar protein sorting-associated protein 9A (OsVPS9A) (Protein GLUTELIN ACCUMULATION 2) n=1 Tax=Durusdinium trenchii TaxID=1381693 RepID=A0ABP0IT62_9DINO